MVENYSANQERSPQDVLAQARGMITTQGAPLTTDNLNRAMLALSQGRDERFGEQLAERAVVQGNRNVPRTGTRGERLPLPPPSPPSSTDGQARVDGTPTVPLVGRASTGGTMEGPIDPETGAILAASVGRTPSQGLPGGSVAPHMVGVPGSPVSIQDYIAGMVGEPPANPGDPAVVAGPAVTGGTMDDVPSAPQYAGPGVPGAPVVLPTVEASTAPRMPTGEEMVNDPRNQLLIQTLMGSRGPRAVGVPPVGLAPRPMPSITPTEPPMITRPVTRMEQPPTITRGPERIAGDSAIPLPGARQPTMIEPPPATPRVSGRVEGSQRRIGKGRLDNDREISQREINRTVSRNLRERYGRRTGTD